MLESVLKDINPVEPSVTSLYMDPYNYDETRRCVNGNISWRILEITRLYGEVKYLTEVTSRQYEVFKRIKEEAPNGFVYFMCLGEIISLAEPGYHKITYLTCSKDKYIEQ